MIQAASLPSLAAIVGTYVWQQPPRTRPEDFIGQAFVLNDGDETEEPLTGIRVACRNFAKAAWKSRWRAIAAAVGCQIVAEVVRRRGRRPRQQKCDGATAVVPVNESSSFSVALTPRALFVWKRVGYKKGEKEETVEPTAVSIDQKQREQIFMEAEEKFAAELEYKVERAREQAHYEGFILGREEGKQAERAKFRSEREVAQRQMAELRARTAKSACGRQRLATRLARVTEECQRRDELIRILKPLEFALRKSDGELRLAQIENTELKAELAALREEHRVCQRRLTGSPVRSWKVKEVDSRRKLFFGDAANAGASDGASWEADGNDGASEGFRSEKATGSSRLSESSCATPSSTVRPRCFSSPTFVDGCRSWDPEEAAESKAEPEVFSDETTDTLSTSPNRTSTAQTSPTRQDRVQALESNAEPEDLSDLTADNSSTSSNRTSPTRSSPTMKDLLQSPESDAKPEPLSDLTADTSSTSFNTTSPTRASLTRKAQLFDMTIGDSRFDNSPRVTPEDDNIVKREAPEPITILEDISVFTEDTSPRAPNRNSPTRKAPGHITMPEDISIFMDRNSPTRKAPEPITIPEDNSVFTGGTSPIAPNRNSPTRKRSLWTGTRRLGRLPSPLRYPKTSRSSRGTPRRERRTGTRRLGRLPSPLPYPKTTRSLRGAPRR
eukprot:TRINITY_DN6642_c0_g1_i4.p1 TRINITY_DN6642_c0_g1~~TRINITY_DN6642_c0_g1_i4.p1  ORF type:complete len:670 (+),score=88.93 TRINITY_DN6642_c0_g1_i4:171-2180(+)